MVVPESLLKIDQNQSYPHKFILYKLYYNITCIKAL